MKKLKRSCFMAILLCAALLFAACLSDNASGPEESAGTESLPGESGGENASGPVDAPHMLVCRSLEELSELQSMLEKSEQEVYAYLQASGLDGMSGRCFLEGRACGVAGKGLQCAGSDPQGGDGLYV